MLTSMGKEPLMTEHQRVAKAYNAMNALWPKGMRAPTPKEAIAGARLLYREGFRYHGKKWNKRTKFELVSAKNQYSWRHGDVFRVNPNKDSHGGGWPAMVHDISHYVHGRVYPDKRGHESHLPTEKHLIEYAIAKGFPDGKLARATKPKPVVEPKPAPEPKPVKPKLSVKAQRAMAIDAAVSRWESKLKRAQNALKKLKVKQRYYAKALRPVTP